MLFWFLSFVAIFSAILVVIEKNPIHSVLYLIVTFFAIAGHYFLLNAQFLAAVHIIVYAGAIMVLFLYVIMMLNLNKHQHFSKRNITKFIGALSAGLLLISLVLALQGVGNNLQGSSQFTQVGLVENLGKILYTDYALPFEIAAVLFLSAMIGAVFLSKKNLS